MGLRNFIGMKIVDVSLATILQKARVQSSYSFIAVILSFVLKWGETSQPLTNYFWSLGTNEVQLLLQVINIIAR